jgi:glycine hydroxymethyltransferase
MSQDIIFKLVKEEEKRQKEMIGLIPSENTVSPEVSKVLSSCLSNKYSEGFPNHRYYEGNQIIDQVEDLARDRLKELFKVPYANVQPYSGSPANTAIYFALMQPGDTILGLKLTKGGHLTHGHPKVTLSGTFYNSVQYGLNAKDRVDFAEVRKLALEHKPKVIVAGNTAYPFELDFKKFRKIADEVGAWLVADISHVTGLVIGGEHMSPVPYVDVIMSTTHKTFRGPRGAMILVTDKGMDREPKLGRMIDSAIIPGTQGGPHNATTAAIAIAADEATKPEYLSYIKQIRKNADALSKALQANGVSLVGGGTETHLMLIDLTEVGYGIGKQVAFAMDVAGIYANANTVPKEVVSPFYPSGVRIGTPLVTSRGMKEKEMKMIADWIAKVIDIIRAEELPEDKSERAEFIAKFKKRALKNKELKEIRKEVKELTSKFPLFTW